VTRQELVRRLEALDLAGSPPERDYRVSMLDLLKKEPACFARNCFPAHFTGSAWVVSHDGARALLTHHRFLNVWLQLGGHCDGVESTLETSRKEALEESGIEGLVLASPRPFDLDIHMIPAHQERGEPAHYHYDVRHVWIAPQNAVCRISEESYDLRWFTPDEMAALPLGTGMVRMLEKWRGLLARRGGQESHGVC